MTAWTEDFERHRSLLFSIAYRMLGSAAEAEDVVQDTYLRWREVPEVEVRSPRSYLSAVVTCLSIDRLRSARARREEYIGPWLPEPLVSERAEELAVQDELDESLSMALVVAYAEAKGCNEAILVYPGPLTAPIDTKVGDIRVRSLAFSVSGDLDEQGLMFVQKMIEGSVVSAHG